MRPWFALLFVAMLAGCTDDAPTHEDDCSHLSGADHQACHEDQAGSDEDPETQPDGSEGTGDARMPITWEIDVGDNSFSETLLTIQVGDTVVWTQTGSNPHTVTADSGDFDSHPDCNSFADGPLGNCMDQGDTFEVTFSEAADVGYYCRIHGSPGGGMSGTIVVQDAPDDTS